MRKFQIPPEQARYSVTDGEETLRTQLDGGKGRYRRDVLNSTSKVTVTWLFGKEQYEYFRAFYKSTTKTASQPFLIDLIMDGVDALTEHTAYFVPGKIKLTKVQGLSYSVQAELEVEPADVDDAFYDIIVLSYEEFGENRQAMLDLLNGLEQLVNVDLPGEPVFVP